MRSSSPRKRDAHLLEEMRVDLVDDLHDARQHAAEHLDGPALEGLGQQRVVGVGEGLARHAPGVRPGHERIVDQQAHQFGDGHRGMRVVQLHGELQVELVHAELLRAQDAQHVLQRTGHEEVLLFQAQLLAARLIIVGVEHLADVFGGHLLIDGAVVIAAVEDGEVEGLRRLGLPEPERVRRVGHVTQDRGVVRHTHDDFVRYPAHSQAVVLIHIGFGGAAEFHLHRPFGPRQFPRVAEPQPLVGLFHLPAVDDLLVEDAELVAYAVAHRRNAECRHGIDEARSEAAEAAVAEAGLLLLLQQIVEVQSHFRHAFLDPLHDAEIDEVVAQMRPHQKFGRQVGDGARSLPGVDRRGADPMLQHAVAHGIGQGHVVIVAGGQRGKLSLHIEQVVEEGVLEGLLGQPDALVLWRRIGQTGRCRFFDAGH